MRIALLLVVVCAACKSREEPQPRTAGSGGSGSTTIVDAASQLAPPARPHGAIARTELNRWAVRENLPLYWISDRNDNKSLDPDEVASLLFYPTQPVWVVRGAFTGEFEAAYDQIVTAAKTPAPAPADADEATRRRLVGEDLDQGRATVVHSDLVSLSDDDKRFVGHMLKVAALVDRLYERMKGADAFVAKLPADRASHSLFRRNRGPKCIGPTTETNPLCSAVPKCTPDQIKRDPHCMASGTTKVLFDIYPAAIQTDDKFCAALETSPAAKALTAPFVVVDGPQAALKAVPYTDKYKPEMIAIADELVAAADSMKDATEKPLVAYLRAAAASFRSNDWQPADEAWAKMTVDNSKWYVRVAPDEVYWEPCSQKAGMHVTFARINQGSKGWQQKLAPVQQQMETAIAERAGKPYEPRNVTFHLPDFIDVVVNAGDDRDALGATIGQSLPNWGPVANEGRGRTVAMTNFYLDADSVAARRAQAESVLDAASLKPYTGTPEPGLLGTILHEATHNLGPAHEYKVNGKNDGEVFTGPIASIMEELKAQTGALFLLEFLRTKKLISDELAAQSYADAIVWAFGHISQGMYDGDGKPKPYSNLAAIQIGFLRDKGVLVWAPAATAANGKDRGAFTLHYDKLVAAVDELMKLVGGIKARGDRAAAEALIKKYVDASTVVPHDVIKERFLRFPKASFVYAISM